MVAIRFLTEGNSYATTSLLSAKLGLSERCSDLGIVPKMSGIAEMAHAVCTGVFVFELLETYVYIGIFNK